MRYSLLSRFQGTLLAAAMGDELETYRQSRRLKRPLLTRTDASDRGQGPLPTTPAKLTDGHSEVATRQTIASTPSRWVSAAISCLQMLTQTGRWNELEMAAIGVRLGAARTSSGTGLEQPRTPLIAAEYILATLPIALFFHENKARQQQLLVQTVQLWQCPPGAEAGLLAVGYAIAQALQDRLEQLTLVPQTITYLQQSTANPPPPLLDLMDALEQVQILLQQGAGLHTAIEQLRARATHLSNRAIALAFYCCLSTPDDLHLALLRAACSGDAAPVVCALTGALSGAHNSLTGLPLVWRVGSSKPSLGGVSDQEMNQLAAQLFAVWSGGYAPTTSTTRFAIAAPGGIRPR
jgi:hypothetical protein